RIAALPENASGEHLSREAEALKRLIHQKVPSGQIAAASAQLRRALVEAYKLRLAPRTAPDVARGKALYAQHCAACHGADGKGDGPAAKGLEPAPSNFHDLDRMAQRSAY